MPPGSGLAQSLRNAHERTIGSRKSRHSLQPNSFLPPSAAHRPHLSKKRRTEPRPPRRSLTNESTDVGSTEQESSSGSTPSRLPRIRKRGLHPTAELYSKKLYRNVATGYDIDGDSDTELNDYAPQVAISDGWKPEYSGGNQELAHPELIPQMLVKDDEGHIILREKTDFIMPAKRVMTDTSAAYYDELMHCSGGASGQICYQVTAQDIIFIEKLNTARRLENNECFLNISAFAEIMKALEVQSFRTIHNHLLDERHRIYKNTADSVDAENMAECDVCRVIEHSEGEDMVFCDMCHTCVHTACAGIDVIPSGPWKCHKCTYANTPSPPCCLCPTLGGSMTYSTDKTMWAHHACALFLPEIIFVNVETREPFTAFKNIPMERFEQICAVCDTNKGACVECSYHECEEVQHVGCALRAGLRVFIQENEDPAGDVTRVLYCHKHSIQKAKEAENAKATGRDVKEEKKKEPERPQLYIAKPFRSFRNPWLAKLESIFYLMTDYEQVGNTIDIEEIVISDVYEYWKQKRLDSNNQPLIDNLRDFVEIVPTIDRVARNIVESLEEKMQTTKPAPTDPVTALPMHFFRRAALMVTEVRQPSLKRVRDTIQKDHHLLTLLEEREVMKRETIRADLEGFDVADLLARKGGGATVLKAWNVSEDEMRHAQDPATFERAMAELDERAFSSPTSQNRKQQHSSSSSSATRSHLSPPKKKSCPSVKTAKSPLRPHNRSVDQFITYPWQRLSLDTSEERQPSTSSAGTSQPTGTLESAATRRSHRGHNSNRRIYPIG